MTTLRHPVIIALMGALLFGASLSLRVEPARISGMEVEGTSTHPTITLRERTEARVLADAFSALPLKAQAVVVWDAKDSHVLYGKDETAQLPLASLTKLMLAYAGDQVIDRNSVVTMTGRDLAEEGSSGIAPGERFSYESLRSATLVASLNDGANAISRTMGEILKKDESPSRQKLAGVTLMNASARSIGLEQTIFYNEAGLDLGSGQPGALGSAKDMAKLFSALLAEYPESLTPTTEDGYILRSLSGQTYQYWNTNQRLSDVPDVLGSKTGYTALADGNLAIAFTHEGHTLVVIILGSSKEGRFDDVKSVVDFLKSHALPKLADTHDILAS